METIKSNRKQLGMNIIDDVIGTEATRKNVRLMLPVMIHWAKTGHDEHTYGDLNMQ